MLGGSRDANGGVAARHLVSRSSLLFLDYISDIIYGKGKQKSRTRGRRMPSTQKKLNLTAKSAKSGEDKSTQNGRADMADEPPFLSRAEADSLVDRITTEVLKGVETSFDKKIDTVLKKLEACSSKIAALDTRVTEAEGRISDSADVVPNHTARLTGSLDLENRGWRCNIRIIGLPEGSEGSNPMSFFKT